MTQKTQKVEKVESPLQTEFEFIQKESEEEEEAEVRPSDLEMMNRVVLSGPDLQTNEGKKKRKVKMISLNSPVCFIWYIDLLLVYVYPFILSYLAYKDDQENGQIQMIEKYAKYE